ncbi:MAG TPA: hypothetical protein VD963_09995, partial [Phycisphaerales bacterium]|nr:hypothetical protein [Phycisphaerales bacterium]
MANVLLISAALTGLLILLMLGWDLLTRRRDIVSFRSIFLLGIFFFYGLATVFTIVLDITPN